ncbi:AsnC family transcriptional regulator [Azoarcus sp. DD4]|uniref:Lrp/AsnC family transcriptional regulator n=1 Tax=Azoarcus sp. DD4 TaxID=2027405 RepID=UPI0011285C93|nr:Lrp/AsnC family transcriptional regulator [Azoarcus sp. DD4]QDF97761.1 AsnC family transcriptional regulator [Azoarcus sp. DD4]
MTIDLDKFDLQLLAELQIDGHASNTTLADLIHLSPSQVSRRIQRLEQSGYIERYSALLRPAAVGLGVTAFTSVSLERHGEVHTDAFNQAVSEMDEVLECFAITGEADYMLRIVAPDLAALSEFMLHRLMRVSGVRSVKSSIVLNEIKRTTRLPLGHLQRGGT